MVTSGYENFLLEVQIHQEENYHSTSDVVAATPAKRNIYNKGNNSVSLRTEFLLTYLISLFILVSFKQIKF